MLPKLASLGWHHGSCGVHQPKRTIPRCGQMSDDHFRASFVKFDGEKKH